MNVAALDLGTNTFLCLIAEVSEGRIEKVLSDTAEVVRLGQGVDQTGCFHPQALARAERCLRWYRDLIDRSQVDRIAAVATSAARDVENRDEFLQILERCEIPYEVISGPREAELTYFGAVDGGDGEGTAVIDVGGGSTEVIWCEGGQLAALSLDIGAVRLTERCLSQHPIAPSEWDHLEAQMERPLQTLRSSLQGLQSPIQRVVAVAGTPTTLAAMAQGLERFEAQKIHGHRLTLKHLEQSVTDLSRLSIEERKERPGLDPGRADVIVAGAAILKKTLQTLGVKELEVSVRGVRYGLAATLA